MAKNKEFELLFKETVTYKVTVTAKNAAAAWLADHHDTEKYDETVEHVEWEVIGEVEND